MAERNVFIFLTILAILLIIACTLIVIFNLPDESAPTDPIKDAIEQVKRAQAQLNDALIEFRVVEDEMLGREPLTKRMVRYRIRERGEK